MSKWLKRKPSHNHNYFHKIAVCCWGGFQGAVEPKSSDNWSSRTGCGEYSHSRSGPKNSCIFRAIISGVLFIVYSTFVVFFQFQIITKLKGINVYLEIKWSVDWSQILALHPIYYVYIFNRFLLHANISHRCEGCFDFLVGSLDLPTGKLRG